MIISGIYGSITINMSEELYTIPDELQPYFLDSEIGIDEEDDDAFLLGFKPSYHSEVLEPVKEILGLDFDINFEGQIYITQSLERVVVEIRKDNNIGFTTNIPYDNEIDLIHLNRDIGREDVIRIIKILHREDYEIYNVEGETILFSDDDVNH